MSANAQSHELTYDLIKRAVHGDQQAIEAYLRYYDAYINSLVMYDEVGPDSQIHSYIDEDNMEILFIQTGGFTLQEKGKDFFAMLAERDHTTVEKVKEKISKRIWEGLHDPDPKRRAQWERIPCAGDVPTPEEWLRYSVERLKEDGREDLLRHYLID